MGKSLNLWKSSLSSLALKNINPMLVSTFGGSFCAKIVVNTNQIAFKHQNKGFTQLYIVDEICDM